MPCLCPQRSYDGCVSEVGDKSNGVKVVMLWRPPQVKYGKGDGGQIERAKDGSHQQRKIYLYENARGPLVPDF